MSIAREEGGVVVAVCDSCGDRKVLDDEPFGPDDEAVNVQLADLGWDRRKPERAKFKAGISSTTVIYDRDFCGDCQTDEPAPRPVFGVARHGRSGPVDAFANDPHDEWPRAIVFALAGLRPMCGHPKAGGVDCPYCRAGYAIGENRPSWRR